MGGAISLNPFDHVKNTVKNIKDGNWEQAILDPGNAFSEPLPDPIEAEDPTGLTEGEQAELASEEAKRTANKKKTTTQTVLTSPLGTPGGPATTTKTLGG